MWKTLFFLTLLSAHPCWAQDMLAGHQQLLVVTTPDWEEKRGCLQRYERADDASNWVSIGKPIPVVIGRTGLAWGIGLHPISSQTDPVKREGDKKSPAGIFSLGSAFGFAPQSEMSALKIEYFQLDASTEAVDDPLSRYYNEVVNSKTVTPDWNSSEKMSQEPLYELGFIVHHNFPNPQKGAGSAIFFHIWRNDNSGTAGCTAMRQQDVTKILFWLDKSKKPLLIQLPETTYSEVQSGWNLPPTI